MSGFDLAQTFFIDKDAAQQAPSIQITSMDLFFYSKPVQGKAKSGIVSPGVTVYVGDVTTDGSPDLTSFKRDSFARVEYASINANTTGSTATTFTFSKPISVRTDVSAAFLISFDGSDPGFALWFNKAGENQFGTTIKTSVTSGKVDGNLFAITNGNTLTPQRDADLSFKLRVANFTTTPTIFKVKNRFYEILKVSSTSGNFIGGEPVYSLAANATGTVSFSSSCTAIVGTGTTLTSLSTGDAFVITDGSTGNTDIRNVVSVTNTTHMIVDVPPSFTNTTGKFYRTVTGTAYFTSGQSDHLLIQDSTANSTIYLSVGNTIYGVDSQASAVVANIQSYGVGAMTPSFVVGLPSGTTINTSIGFANSSFVFSGGNAQDFVIGTRYMLNRYPAVVASHTTEVTTGTPFTSIQNSLTFTTANKYVSPYVDEENLDMFLETYQINNDDTNEYLGTGNAQTRYISRTVNLGADQLAEDIKVYVSAYKPANTDIKVYAKLRNNSDIETMEIKNWTELVANTTGTDFSSTTDISDYLEIGYDLPFQPIGTQQTGTFTTTLSSAVITGTSGAVNTGIAVGSVIRLYNPYFSNSYFIDTVTASNTTTFTIASAVANSSMAGTGFLVDTITRKNSAFLDVQKENIVSYYNSSLSLFQGYDSFAIKIVLLSDNGFAVPLIDDVRAIALSA